MQTTWNSKDKIIAALSGIPNVALNFRQFADNGWAIIKNPEYERGVMLRGELLFYSLDRKEAYEKLKHTKEHVAFRHFTKRDPNVVYLL